MQSRPRPTIVTLLSLGVLTLAAVFLTRLAIGLRPPPFPNTIPAWYLPLTGAVWGVGSLLLGGGMLTGKRWALVFARPAAIAFILWYWADRILLSRSDYAAFSRPVDAAITLAAMAIFFWGLDRNGTRDYFGEKP